MKNLTLSSMLKEYEKLFPLSEEDVKYNQKMFNAFISLVGDKKINDLTPSDCNKYKIWRYEQIYRGKKTIYMANLHIRLFKAIFNKLLKFELIEKNHWTKISQYKLPERKKLNFETSDMEKVLETISNKSVYNISYFCFNSGLRLAEVINIKWEHINFKDNLIEVINTEDFTTKSKKNRYIPISIKLLAFLNELEKKSQYVFPKEDGNKYTKRYISKKFKKFIRKAGLNENLHFHSTRHTFCTNLLKNNVPVIFVQNLMGHANIQTTMKYCHVSTNDLRDAVNMI